MGMKIVQGKKFILIAKNIVGNTSAVFPDKTVIVSGKGVKSGKPFTTEITIKSGRKKKSLDGFVFKPNGTLSTRSIKKEIEKNKRGVEDLKGTGIKPGQFSGMVDSDALKNLVKSGGINLANLGLDLSGNLGSVIEDEVTEEELVDEIVEKLTGKKSTGKQSGV
jgi:hypothetical protein